MDWLEEIDQDAIILVPTRGLQHSLSKRYANQQLAKGHSAWQTPKILVWDDYIEYLWQANKHNLEKAFVRLDTQQAFLIWQQIILKAKKSDDSLLLLNESQTANVVQRSWKLFYKWRINDLQENSHYTDRQDIDSAAFTQWCYDYHRKLLEKNWIDTVLVESTLIDMTSKLNGLPSELIFAYFDLITANQQYHIDGCKRSGVDVKLQTIEPSVEQEVSYRCYQTEEEEWQAVFFQARQQLEQNQQVQIGIVIPQLSEQRARVEQVARSIFYPDKSPLQCQQLDLAYRFSLGRPLNRIPYIHAMLNTLALMKNTFTYQELRFLFMCAWWPKREDLEYDLIDLDRALKRYRCTWLNWRQVLDISQKIQPEAEQLHDHFRSFIAFQNALYQPQSSQEKPQFKFARQWQTLFSEWLRLFFWHENDLDSWHYQAHESWLSVLETFVGFDLVQSEISLSKALRMLNMLCADKVYLRQAKSEPILISGVLEGIGNEVDFLFVCGMHEAYPPTMKADPFISSNDLAKQGYPFADKSDEFHYEQNKLNSLLSGGQCVQISYARQHEDGDYHATALLRDHSFTDVTSKVTDPSLENIIKLEEYIDVQGQPCMNSAVVQGGSKVFENQSNCPFKAYVEHRIIRQTDQEPEFGLDARDAGVIVHALLENIWLELGTYSVLSVLDEAQLKSLVSRNVEFYLDNPPDGFQFDRKRLLQLEKPRLNNLLFQWLRLEQEQRSLAYSVIGRETSIKTEFAGIPIKLIVDRIDQTDGGECLIIDYKTGQAELSSWSGERPSNPQMPLYAVVLEKQSEYDIKGIAFAKVKTNEPALIGLTDIQGVGAQVRTMPVNKNAMSWHEQLEKWQTDLSQLAADFLDGYAAVEPLKKTTCHFCDLQYLCRISQLRAQTGQAED